MKDSKLKASFNNKSFRNGSYSAGLSVIVLAILIVINLVVGALPERFTEYDMSPSLLYEIGDTSRAIIADLDKDVDITVIAQQDKIDERINTYLTRYSELSSRISLQYRDPVLHPEVLTEYEGVTEDSVIVSCPETGRSNTFTFSDIIVKEVNQYYFYYYGRVVEDETKFDGEGLLTSAISYVTSTDDHIMYTLTGHGEHALSEAASGQLTKSNIQLKELDMIRTPQIPEDAESLMIYCPDKDISEDEADSILDYMQDGGRVVIFTTFNGQQYPHLNKIVENYGGSIITDQYLVDMTEGFYYTQNYILMPQLVSTGDEPFFTSLDANSKVLLNIAQPINKIEDMRSSVKVTPLLATSQKAASVGPDSQTEGQYVIAIKAEERVDNALAKLVVVTSDLVNEQLTANFSSAANLSAFTDCVTSVFDSISNISVPTKSLQVSFNTVTNRLPYTITFVFVVPVAFLAAGFIIWNNRRKK